MAESLARDGWRLHLAHRGDPARADRLRLRLDALGSRYTLHAADLGDPDASEGLADRALADGPVHALVHAAGTFDRAPLPAYEPAALRHAWAVTAEAFHILARALVPPMMARGDGRVVAFGHATVSRLSAPPAIAGYYAAKAALVALARAWARETAGRGVTVNVVSPGVLDSGGVAPDTLARLAQSVPGGVPGSPEAVLSPVRFLLSDAAAYVTGAELCVTGGWGL